ncbi:MAG: lipoprotein [Anaerolineaceae bacterium]
MKRLLRVFLLIALLSILPGCSLFSSLDFSPSDGTESPLQKTARFFSAEPPPSATPPPKTMAAACAALVDGIYSLRSGLDFPQYFQEENPVKQGGEFDPNRYFEILTRLHMAPGYVLDYAYRYDGMGGAPLLYARKADKEPFNTAAELQAAFDTGEKVDPDKPSFGWNEQYLSHVQVDGSPESYLEFTTLAILGGQFYLFWHSNYYDTVVICGPDGMKYVQEELSAFQIELPPDSQAAAENIDFTPTVTVEGQSVTVRLVTFSKWGGFSEEVYVLDRENPSKILEQRTTPLVEYDCGIMF